MNTRHFIQQALLSLATCVATAAPCARAAAPTTEPTAARTLHVAVYRDTGSPDKGWENVAKCLSVHEGQIAFTAFTVTAEDLQAGKKLRDADVLVQPGGSGSKQAQALGQAGCDTIRKFVRSGHGYVGICAGAYLATNDYAWSLGLINAHVVDRAHWNRGLGNVQLGISPDGHKILGIEKDEVPCIYHQGPLLAPNNKADLPPFVSLATFDTEVVENGAKPGVMKGTTAIAAAPCDAGRVICISPHPERSEGLDGLIRRAVLWTAQHDATPATKPSAE